jgi:hypothetical protein
MRLSFAAATMLMFLTFTLKAQENNDSTRSADQTAKSQNTETNAVPLNSEQGSLETVQQQNSHSWKAEDRVVISTEEIPPRLRLTLETGDYKGWENSTLYKNRTTSEYMIEIRDGSLSKVFYFDKDGNAVPNRK